MKHFIVSVLAILAILGCYLIVHKCKDNRSTKSNRIIVNDNRNRNTAVFMGYVLGEPTASVTDSLIREGTFKASTPTCKTYHMSLGNFSEDIIVEGYPLDLSYGGKKYDALLSPIEKEGKLISLHIYIDGSDSSPIIERQKFQYGEQTIPPKGGYMTENPDRVVGFWNIANEAVYLEQFEKYMVLIYDDIYAIQDINNKAEGNLKAEDVKLYNSGSYTNTDWRERMETDEYKASLAREIMLKQAGMKDAAKIERAQRNQYLRGGGYDSKDGGKQVHYNGSAQQQRDLDAIDKYMREHPDF